ncbi:Dabb family protein [Streptomyces sp. NBC_00335]|uniref:Dabb family protein n=1 Tax=unclassified Streptomyces TaxID=2593676 RepID=UPI002259FB1D|nr:MULTISPECIES: Dabb family protein [unclassified Streptomyces]MCX5410219.1 Dabb family protein [Streptomyces sp. NBC_00086]
MLVHVVLMRFTDPAHAPEAAERLRRLDGSVPQIRSLSVGLDVTGSDLSYDLVLTTRHADAGELVAYQSHPEHRRLASWLGPLLADRAVVDHLEP